MKSRISIDVDEDNQPVIKIEYSPSEDVRDKLVKKFLETFGSASAWARTSYLHVPDAPVLNNTMLIRPIPSYEMGDQSQEMAKMFSFMPKVTDPPEKEITYGAFPGTVSCSACQKAIYDDQPLCTRNEKIFCENCFNSQKM